MSKTELERQIFNKWMSEEEYDKAEARILALLEKHPLTCWESCGAPITVYDIARDEDGEGKYWGYFRCHKCTYGWAFWKIERRILEGVPT